MKSQSSAASKVITEKYYPAEGNGHVQHLNAMDATLKKHRPVASKTFLNEIREISQQVTFNYNPFI